MGVATNRFWVIDVEGSGGTPPEIVELAMLEVEQMEDIADDILQWIENTPIVGHNVRVEVDILSRSIPDWSPRVAIDTLKLAKALRPGLPSYGLANLGSELGLTDQAAELSGRGHHSALYDATLTALILIELLSPLTSEGRAKALRDANILDPKQGSLL